MKLAVLHEDYCPACGGTDTDPFSDPTAGMWPHGKVMTGHRYKCSVGEMGSPIATSTVASNKSSKSGLWMVSGRFPSIDIEDVYSGVKEHGGMIVGYKGNTNVYISVMFDDYASAEGFQKDYYRFNGPLDPADIVPPGEMHELAHRFNNGDIDATFVRQYALS